MLLLIGSYIKANHQNDAPSDTDPPLTSSSLLDSSTQLSRDFRYTCTEKMFIYTNITLEWEALLIIWYMQSDENKRRGAMQKSAERIMKCRENGERNLVSCAFIPCAVRNGPPGCVLSENDLNHKRPPMEGKDGTATPALPPPDP